MASVLTRSIHVTRRVRGTPEQLFDAWLDADVARRWLFATATEPMTQVEIDARVGGSFASSTIGVTSSTPAFF